MLFTSAMGLVHWVLASVFPFVIVLFAAYRCSSWTHIPVWAVLVALLLVASNIAESVVMHSLMDPNWSFHTTNLLLTAPSWSARLLLAADAVTDAAIKLTLAVWTFTRVRRSGTAK